MTDDWGIWLSLTESPLLDSLHYVGFEQPGRLLAGPYYVFLYEVIGDVPWLHGVLLGAINAAVVAAAWLVGRKYLPASVLWPAIVVLALAPNHAMTRVWFVAGYYPLALTLVLIGLWLLSNGRWAGCALCFFIAALLFEGVLGLGLGTLALWTLVDVRRRWLQAAAVAVPATGALGVMYTFSSKRGGTRPFNNADSLFSGQLGVGLWGTPTLARIAGGAVLVGLTWALATRLPSFRTEEPEGALVLLGASLAVAGALPFLLTGMPFAISGLFDRNNLVASVGVAVMLGALWSKLKRTNQAAAVAVGLLVVMVFVQGQVEDLRNWTLAYDRGEEVIGRLAASELDSFELILVVPGQVSYAGMGDFVYDTDLTGAMRHRHGGDWSGVRLIENVACGRGFRPVGPVQVVDWRMGTVIEMSGAEVARRCQDLRDG